MKALMRDRPMPAEFRSGKGYACRSTSRNQRPGYRGFIHTAFAVAFAAAPAFSCAPQSPESGEPAIRTEGDCMTKPQPSESKRLLWIIPNYRTSPSLKDYAPLAPREKFKIATEDSDRSGHLCVGGPFRRAGAVNEFRTVLRARRCRLCPLLLDVLRRLDNR